jgi:molybdopterin molybdotransferase
MPEGADSLVRFEDTDENNGYVESISRTVCGKNYRLKGEIIKKGDTVLRRGERLNSADIGILASLNYGLIKVHKQPVVQSSLQGDELADIGKEIQDGHIETSMHTPYIQKLKVQRPP